MNNEVDKKLIRKCILCGREYVKPQAICPKCNMPLMKLSDYERLDMESNRAKLQKEVERQEKVQREQNTPKCPICQSTNLSKITTVQKAGKIVLFGIFGMGDNGKTWKCNNCGSKF